MSEPVLTIDEIVDRIVNADEIAINEVDLNYMVLPNAAKRADQIVDEAKAQLQRLMMPRRSWLA